MKITVITASYNSAATIAATLQSLASQTWPSIEHIIVDGGSTDDTLALVRRHTSSEQRVVSEPDAGIYDAMNKGIAMATGDVIGFLNSDDTFAHPRVLEEYAEGFADSSVDACYGDLVYVSRSDPARVVRYWKAQPFFPGAFKWGWIPPHPTFYARKKVYERHGYFNLGMPLAADFEIMCRFIHARGLRTAYLPGVKVKMLLGGATNASVKNVFEQNRQIIAALKLHGVPVDLRYVMGKTFFRAGQFVRKVPAPSAATLA